MFKLWVMIPCWEARALIPLNSKFLLLLVALPAFGLAQTQPTCPQLGDVYIGAPDFVTPLTPSSSVRIAIRRYIGDQVWDFVPENLQIVGFSVSLDAVGEQRNWSFPGPLSPAVLGTLNPGTYAVTIRPVATNVVPSVACPVLVTNFVIEGVPYEYMPVPSTAWLSAGLLALLLGGAGVWSARRRVEFGQ